MALNIEAMKSKLEKLNGKADSNKKFWRPEEGENNIRVVSTSDGDPFKEKWFHYNVGTSGFLCPKRNFGDNCPVCNFGNQLWNEGTEESKRQAKDLFAKQRFFSPVLVRGEEDLGIRVWGYGKMAYEKLLTIVLDPDYGDVTDPETGNDLKIMYGKLPGASFPRTDIRPRPRKTALCDDAVGGDDRCAELLETIPDFENIFERKSTEEVQSILDQFMSSEGTREDLEKFGTKTNNAEPNAVESAFNDLLGS